MWGNAYYEFDEPVRWFKKVGISASNTWVGRSRAFETVYEPTVIQAGDQVHALVGGTFVMRKDGSIEEGAFRLPKHIFERNDNWQPDRMLVDAMAKAGRCHVIPASKDGIKYRSGDPVHRFPDNNGCLLKGRFPASPLLEKLDDAYDTTLLGDAVSDYGGQIHRIDVGYQPDSLDCEIRIDFPEGQRISVIANPTRSQVWVNDRTGSFADSVKTDAHPELEAEFRNERITIFPEAQANLVFEAILNFADRRFGPQPQP